jgi:hypothetical protein
MIEGLSGQSPDEVGLFRHVPRPLPYESWRNSSGKSSATAGATEIFGSGVRRAHPRHVDKGYVYKLVNNHVYIGQAVHKGTAYPGEHQAIISQALWDEVHSILIESPCARPSDADANTRTAEGPDLRADRPGHDAGAHPQGWKALPLLRVDRRAEARR